MWQVKYVTQLDVIRFIYYKEVTGFDMALAYVYAYKCAGAEGKREKIDQCAVISDMWRWKSRLSHVQKHTLLLTLEKN